MTIYFVEVSDRAEAEVERTLLWLARRSPEGANLWHIGLIASLEKLTTMPNRRPIARENDAYEGVTVRQFSYGKWRILYHVIEPTEGEESGVVRVLHVLHGAQILGSAGEEE